MLRGSPLRKKFDVTKVMITHTKNRKLYQAVEQRRWKVGRWNQPGGVDRR